MSLNRTLEGTRIHIRWQQKLRSNPVTGTVRLIVRKLHKRVFMQLYQKTGHTVEWGMQRRKWISNSRQVVLVTSEAVTAY